MSVHDNSVILVIQTQSLDESNLIPKQLANPVDSTFKGNQDSNHLLVSSQQPPSLDGGLIQQHLMDYRSLSTGAPRLLLSSLRTANGAILLKWKPNNLTLLKNVQWFSISLRVNQFYSSLKGPIKCCLCSWPHSYYSALCWLCSTHIFCSPT